MTEINIPSGIEAIAADAFADVTSPLLIQTVPDSYGVQYAFANQLDFRADTVFRALLIGQSDYPAGYQLNAPVMDAAAMENALSADYTVTRKENLTADQILSAIAQTFSGTKDTDISLFYYAGHGRRSNDPSENGSLVGIDFASYISPSQLRTALDGVRGRKIVVVDACYSGSFIGRSADAAESPAAAFIRAFQTGAGVQASSLTAQQYFVFAASAGNELSWEKPNGGVFTSAFLESMTLADQNGDGVITMQECYAYTSSRVQEIVSKGNLVQTVQVYPENCSWFGLFR